MDDFMRTGNALKVPLPAVLAAGVALYSLITGPAEARRVVKPYYSWTYELDRPVRGYEGHVFPGYYCSYKRYPRRVCRTDGRGNETCRIRGWTLEQTCQ